MRYILNYGCIIISVVFNSFFYKSALGQSQEYPPSFIDEGFIYQNWTTQDGLPVNSISSIIQSRKGYLWLGTEDGLVRFDGVRFKVYNNTTHPGLGYNRVKDLTTFGDGLLILNSRNEIIAYNEGVFSQIELPESLKGVFISSIQELENGDVIFKGSGLNSVYREGVFEEFKSVSGGTELSNTTSNYSKDVNSGEVFYTGEKILEIENKINDLILDHEGNAWVASFSKGLYRIKKSLFKVFSIDQGLPGRNIYPITESNDGTIWVGTFGSGIISINGDVVSSGYSFEGLSNNVFVQSILERENGDFLVALMGGEIFKYSGGKEFKVLDTPDFETVNCFFEDSKKRFYVGTNSGLFYLENGVWVNQGEQEIAKASIKDITEAPDGSIWIGTNSQGLFHINGSTISSFDKRSGISSDNIRSLWIDKGGSSNEYRLWVGTEDQGLNRVSIENGKATPFKVVNYNTDIGLFDQVIHRIIPDDRGLIWMSSNRGLFWVYHYELEEFAKGNLDKITSRGYTEQDGLRNREFNGGIQPAGIKSSDGMLWFPSQDGVVKVNPLTVPLNSKIPYLYIEEVRSNASFIEPVPSRIVLEKGDRDLSLRFTSLSYSSPQKNEFKYRLFGFEDEWVNSNDNRTARYTNLAPGTYTFKVIGNNSEGLWNLQGAVVYIVILPYFYEAGWFYFLILVSIVGLFILLSLWCRNKASKAVEVKEKELKVTEARLAELEEKLDDRYRLKKLLLLKLEDDLKKPLYKLKENAGSSNIKEVIEVELANMMSRIDQFLLLTRVNIGEVSLNLESENLVEVVENALEEIRSGIIEVLPKIEFTTNTQSVNILMEKDYINIVFKNLISWFTDSIGITRIRIQVIEEGSMCTVKISGDGVNLENGELRRIFSLFKSLDYSEGDSKPLGISLPLAARLVELHKATVMVHSIPEKGNVFAVVFKKGTRHLDNV